MAANQELPELKKYSKQWVVKGERVTLSAEWEVKDIDGLLISKRRISGPGGPSAWKVHARRESAEVNSHGIFLEAVAPASRGAEEIAEKLEGQWFETREEALWAIVFTKEKIDGKEI